MVKTSLSSENEPCCSKACKKNTETLNSKITDLTDKLSDAKNMIYHYKLALAQVEARLAEHKNQELKYCEKIRVLEFETESRADCIESLTKDLELLKKEKGDLETKLIGFQTASKDLDSLLESQRLDKNKEGLGYSAVPPPPAQIYSPPKKDLSWTGLPEFTDDTVTDYSRPVPTIEGSLNDLQKKITSVIKTGASDSTISSKPFIKFVKAADRPTKDKTDKVETAKKPTIKYAKLYRRTSKSSKVRGNQRNWNNLKSQQLGENFVKKNKACFNYGHFDHLSYDCRLGVKMGRACPKNNNTHKSMPPIAVVHKTVRLPTRTNRPNMNVAQPRRTNFPKTKHSYVRRPFQETTQDLMIILIHRVKMLENKLKARTSPTKVHKVDRGKSRPVMAWVPKKGEGSGTPAEPYHTPSPEAQQTSPTTHSSPILPPITTALIPTITPFDTPYLRQYTRRARIAQSSALLLVADEPASPLRDVSQGEACPTDSSFEADQDRTNIAKTSTLPHESTSRVTSLAADEGSMQHKLDELTALCTSLQRQQSEMDKDRGVAERSGDDAPIKGRNLDEGEAVDERVSDDTEEMETVLISIDAASILSSGGVQVVITAAEVATATLYDSCGVHYVTSKDNEIFTLIEKDYPLRKGLGRIVGNKVHKAFLLPVMEFPLAEEVPTASEESSHYQKKRDATAEKIALLLKSSSNCQSKSYDSYAKLVPHARPVF
nr:ribonuclease H-like domain-containing protein [Tanacetum cinerariifolium]